MLFKEGHEITVRIVCRGVARRKIVSCKNPEFAPASEPKTIESMRLHFKWEKKNRMNPRSRGRRRSDSQPERKREPKKGVETLLLFTCSCSCSFNFVVVIVTTCEDWYGDIVTVVKEICIIIRITVWWWWWWWWRRRKKERRRRKKERSRNSKRVCGTHQIFLTRIRPLSPGS